MNNPPVEIWQLIAEYIEHPNPAMLTRLAAINRNAYAVFTCDPVWRPVSPLHLKKNHFINCVARVEILNPQQKKLMVKAWAAVEDRYDQRGGSARIYVQNAVDNLYFREMMPVAEKNPEVMLPIAIWYGLNPLHCKTLDLPLWTNREFVSLAVAIEGRCLAQCPKFCDDEEIVASALQLRGEMLEIVSARLASSRKMVLLAASSFGSALRFADSSFANDREIAMAAVSSHGWSLQRVSPDLQGDVEIVRRAIESYAGALQLAAQPIQNNKAIVLEAVERQGRMLQYASATLRDDPEVVAVAVTNCPEAIEYASPRLIKQTLVPVECVVEECSYWARHAAWATSPWVSQI